MYEELEILLMWCTIINFGLLMVSSLLLMLFQKQVLAMHKKFIDLSEDQLKAKYFDYLANYKLLVIVFNFVPFLAIRFMV